MDSKVRVRFAPSPTGAIHLGNIRTALFNYLFAKQNGGTFVLRIEDTDQVRNVELAGKKIIDDLHWLGLSYDEGPIVGGTYAPYVQSERTKLYQEKLDQLILNQKVYRCFCSKENLEKKRKDQISKDLPPRYDRTCLNLSDDMIKQKLNIGMPFVWRLKINPEAVVEVNTLARGKMTFDLKNFSDFALTRADGSFTFMFSNFVDDWMMHITFVIRGEDHLTNTAMQAALFDSFAIPLPFFWHLPMLCNKEGKKMSKRDFGFSLDDLKKDGFLPQAICNYLATVGYSFEKEVQSIDELAQNFDFDHLHSTGSIRFDVEKLRWFNHKWIERLDSQELLKYAKPFLQERFTSSKDFDDSKLIYLLEKVKSDVKTLNEFCDALLFYFEEPKVDKSELSQKFGEEKVAMVLKLIKEELVNVEKVDFFLEQLKVKGKDLCLKPKETFGSLRYILSGHFQGLSMHDLLDILDWDVVRRRIEGI